MPGVAGACVRPEHCHERAAASPRRLIDGGGDAAGSTAKADTDRAPGDSEARLERATAAAEIGIWDWDLATNRPVYSRRAKQICGFPPDHEMTYADARRVIHPEDFPFTSARVARALNPALRDRNPYR